MAKLSCIALTILLFNNLILSQAIYGSSSTVLQLTPDNFNSKVLNSNEVVLVEFFAPRCGHCEVLTPIWEKAATVLKGVVTVAALDADAHKSLAQEYGIRGFPTIKAFSPGKPPVDYQGARDLKAITEFAIQQTSTLAILAALAPSPSPSPPSPSFNHYVRVEQWALGVCKDPKIKCISTTLPKIFTVHGLWPSNKSQSQPSVCSHEVLNQATLIF